MSEELENVVETEEITTDEVIDNEGHEETEGNEEGRKEETLLNKDDYIPKNVALQWKKELKEIKKSLNQYKEKEIQDEHRTKIESIRKKVIEKGYDEDFAMLFGELANDLFSTVKRDDPIEHEVSEELEELSEYYPEIGKYKKDIVEKVKKFRKADPEFSVEDAIKLIGTKTKTSKTAKEIELEVEQRQLLARRNNEKSPAPSSAGSVKEQYPLSADDLRVLKGLQEHHPDDGWTKKKFYELMVKNKRR